MNRRCTVVVLVIVALVAGACSSSSPPQGDSAEDFPSAVAAENATPTVTDGWDPLLREYIEFVQDVRGEHFTGTANISFIDPEEGDRRFAGTPPRSSERSERTDDLYRALGLTTGDFDVIAEREKLVGAPQAFYDIGRRLILLPSRNGETMEEVPLSMQPVLVHELTHALQAQTRLGQITAIDDSDLERALVEGEANWVFDQYVATFDDNERDAWRSGSQLFGELPAVPEVIHADNLLPYELGVAFFTARHADGGLQAMNAVFSELPTSSAAILDPFGWVELEGLGVQAPDDALRGEHRQVAMGSVANLSPFRVYQILAAAIPANEALLATRAADSSALPLTWIDEDRLCLAATVGAAHPDHTLLGNAFDTWASLAPEVRSVTRIDGGLLIEACDPGPGQVPPPIVEAVEALRRAAFLIEGEARAVELGLAPDRGLCSAWVLIQTRGAPLAFDSRYELKALEVDDLPIDCRSG